MFGSPTNATREAYRAAQKAEAEHERDVLLYILIALASRSRAAREQKELTR